jgi:cytochrome c553
VCCVDASDQANAQFARIAQSLRVRRASPRTFAVGPAIASGNNMRMRNIVCSGVMLSLLSCKTTGPNGPDRTPEASAPTPASLQQKPTLQSSMKDHDKRGAAMRDAVARGDLDGTRREAHFLVDLRLDREVDPTWRQKLDSLNAAAARVVNSTDLTEASRGLGAVAKTCGDCHAMIGKRDAVTVEPVPDDSGVRPRMLKHQWAIAQLWNGLVVPSDEAWRAGANALADAPLSPALLTPGKTPVPKVGVLTSSVHDMGRKAQTLGDAQARAAILGDLMATCAACHVWFGAGPSSAP